MRDHPSAKERSESAVFLNWLQETSSWMQRRKALNLFLLLLLATRSFRKSILLGGFIAAIASDRNVGRSIASKVALMFVSKGSRQHRESLKNTDEGARMRIPADQSCSPRTGTGAVSRAWPTPVHRSENKR